MLLQKNRGTLFFPPALGYTSLPCPVILKGLASVRKVMLAPCCLAVLFSLQCLVLWLLLSSECRVLMISNFLPLNHAVIEVLPHRVKNENSPRWSFPYGRTFWKVMFVIKCISRLSANTEWGPDREHFVLICTAHLCVLHVLSAAAAFPHLVVKWSCRWSTFTVSIDMLMIKLKYRKKSK